MTFDTNSGSILTNILVALLSTLVIKLYSFLWSKYIKLKFHTYYIFSLNDIKELGGLTIIKYKFIDNSTWTKWKQNKFQYLCKTVQKLLKQ